MLKNVLCLVVLVFAPLQVAAQPPQPNQQPKPQPNQQIVSSKHSVPIRFSPPTPWLLGLPGWEVAQTQKSERYKVLSKLEIHAFSSTHTWAKIELEDSKEDPKSGWVYWGESLEANKNFKAVDKSQ